MAEVISLSEETVNKAIPPPEKWSYSSAKAFEDCPKKWWLSQIRFPIFNGPIPKTSNKKALEGILLHKLLREYSLSPLGFRPRQSLKALINGEKENFKHNPRIGTAVHENVSVDRILTQFHQMYARIVRVTTNRENANTASGDRRYGCEVLIKDPNSKLFGYIDYVDEEGLSDFKSGKESEDFKVQCLFYAALWMAKWGSPPKTINIIYSGEIQSVEFSEAALTSFLEKWRSKITSFERLIEAGIHSKPSSEICKKCHVRALCCDYWEAVYSVPSSENTELYTDYMPSENAIIEKGPLGFYIRDSFGPYPSSLFLPVTNLPSLARMRILNLQVKFNKDRFQLIATASSKIFLEIPDLIQIEIGSHS